MARSLRFDFEWRLTLFTVILVPVLVALGIWQLQRADEKAVLSASREARAEQAPVDLSDLVGVEPAALPYRRVKITGEFSPEQYFLLDNRTRRGRFGYEVLAVFHWAGGVALVNRGWIEADPARLSRPQVPVVTGRVGVAGHVYVTPGQPFLLAEQQLSGGWPKLIQAVEMDVLAAAVGGEVFPYPIRLDEGQPGALTTDWQVVNVSPQKHQAYAVQWFAMATTLLIFYLLRCSNLWQVVTGRGLERG